MSGKYKYQLQTLLDEDTPLIPKKKSKVGPGHVMTKTEKKAKKLEIMEVLRSVVTKERASEALYRQCHPNDVIRDEYVEKLKRMERIAELKDKQRAEALRARKKRRTASS